MSLEKTIREINALSKIYPNNEVFGNEVREVLTRIKKEERAIEDRQKHLDELIKTMSVSEVLKASIKKSKEDVLHEALGTNPKVSPKL